MDAAHIWDGGIDSNLVALVYVYHPVQYSNFIIPACHSNYEESTNDFQGFVIGLKCDFGINSQ